MSPVTTYTKTYCGYSRRAKALLEARGVTFEDIDVTEDTARFDEMVQRAGGKTTVPQVFIHGRHVGGCEQLEALDASGELEALLSGEARGDAHV